MVMLVPLVITTHHIMVGLLLATASHHFRRRRSACHLRQGLVVAALVAVDRYQPQRQLASSMGFRRRRLSERWSTQMGESREIAASALRMEQEWLLALETIVIGDTSTRAGDRDRGGRERDDNVPVL